MSKKLIIVLAHQDDEFCIFNKISRFKNKNNIFIFYLTSGLNYNLNKFTKNLRDNESLKVLRKFGILERNIFFLGRKNSINNNCLYLNLDTAYKDLVEIIKNIPGKKIALTHALEGGHEDHDACYYLVKAINIKYDLFEKSFQFPAYHGKNLPYIFFKVFSPISENGYVFKEKIQFNDRFKFIYCLFFYKSQLKTWVGLYPFIIFKFLFNKKDSVQKINKNTLIRKPHIGKLLYEKRKFCKYYKFRKKLLIFFNRNIL